MYVLRKMNILTSCAPFVNQMIMYISFFFCDEKRKKRTKERKTRGLIAALKFNQKLANSLSSNNARPVIVSLRAANKFSCAN